MAIKQKYQRKHEDILRDARPALVRAGDALRGPVTATSIFFCSATLIYMDPLAALFADIIFLFNTLYFLWLLTQKTVLPFKLPKSAKMIDRGNLQPTGKFGKSEGILYLGNEHHTGEEVWFTNSDARTHILFLGTTGSGKTEGLKSLSTNALCWGSGFIYVDGKADTDLWSSISSMARRFGRDDDLLIMNYMTGNAEGRVASNTLNPFSSGSASYLTNMLVSLMPDAEGDNAMWKERAVALASSLMPCLVWKRENMNIPLNVSVIRKALEFSEVIRLARDESVPETLRIGVVAYLNELPGYVDDAFDDDGNEKPMPPDAPMVDTSVPRQQHGYLSMQFTRSLQSLGDDYAYIFDTQAADVDMMDVVLQRRILITLIPALEKSSDETANLGKIIASTLKGMMGATLGHTVEGASETAIENKPTRSETPFMAIFDEVGYYTAQGMAVMAAQARSLGFCLVYAAQDLPALEKRVKEEARSITANCNIKLFGKLEDPTQTKDFFEKTVGSALVAEASSFTRDAGSFTGSYNDSNNASVQARARADYDELRAFKEGRAIVAFGEKVVEMQVYYCNPGMAKAMRVQRFLPIIPPGDKVMESMRQVNNILKRFRSKKWDPEAQDPVTETYEDVFAIAGGFGFGKEQGFDSVTSSTMAVAALAEHQGLISTETILAERADKEEDVQIVNDLEEMSDNKSPVSWMDIIGGEGGAANMEEQMVQDKASELSDQSAPPAPPAPPTAPPAPESIPATSEDVTAAEEQGLQPMSWMDIVGGGGADVTPSAEPPQPPPVAETPIEQPPAAPPVETATEPPPAALPSSEDNDEVQPLSWADVLGQADETPAPAAPAAPPTEAAPPPTAPPAPPQPDPVAAPPAAEEPTVDEDQFLSWADIIGSDDNQGS